MTNHKYEVIHSMDGKIKPCPLCGAEFELIHESGINCNGKEVNYYYWMQKREDYCLLEEILCNSFTIGAGDCNIETGYVGEYGQRWNESLEGNNNGR